MTTHSPKILIEICSNCKSHQWCTRHNQLQYEKYAAQLSNHILTKLPSSNIKVSKVSGNKMGAFEIFCNETEIFSKRTLGYFPHTDAVTHRIVEFVEGRLVIKQDFSPIKKRPITAQSPFKDSSPHKKTATLLPMGPNSNHQKKIDKSNKSAFLQTSPKVKTPTMKEVETKQPKKQEKKAQKKEEKKKQSPKKEEKKKQQAKKPEPKKPQIKKQEVKKAQIKKQSQPKTQEKKQIPKKQQQPKKKEQVKAIQKPKEVIQQKAKQVVQQKPREVIQQTPKPVDQKPQVIQQKPQAVVQKVQQPQKVQIVAQKKEQKISAPIKQQKPEQIKPIQQATKFVKIQQIPKVQEQKKIQTVVEQPKQQTKQPEPIVIKQQQKKEEKKPETPVVQVIEERREKQEVKQQKVQVKQEAKKQQKEGQFYVEENEGEQAINQPSETKTVTKEGKENRPAQQQPAKELSPIKSTVQIKENKIDGQTTVIKYKDFQNEVDKLFTKLKRDKNEEIKAEQIQELSDWFLKDLEMDISEETKQFFNKYFLQMVDTNKDGKISYQQFKNICWQCLGQGDDEQSERNQ